jgi:hypothetical protein
MLLVFAQWSAGNKPKPRTRRKTMTKKKRNRRTKAEMAEHYRKLAEQYEAELDGSVDTSSQSGVLKALRAALRKRETQLRAARITLDGVTRDDGNGFVRSPIDEKIAHTLNRLESQQETKARAEEAVAAYPFDIERLQALIAAAELGEDVEMPDDLTPLPGDESRTDEEHEAAFIAKGENAES